VPTGSDSLLRPRFVAGRVGAGFGLRRASTPRLDENRCNSGRRNTSDQPRPFVPRPAARNPLVAAVFVAAPAVHHVQNPTSASRVQTPRSGACPADDPCLRRRQAPAGDPRCRQHVPASHSWGAATRSSGGACETHSLHAESRCIPATKHLVRTDRHPTVRINRAALWRRAV